MNLEMKNLIIVIISINILIISCHEISIVGHKSCEIVNLKNTKLKNDEYYEEFHGYGHGEYIVGNIPNGVSLRGSNGCSDGFYRLMYCVDSHLFASCHFVITKYAYRVLELYGWKGYFCKYKYHIIDFPTEEYKKNFYNELKKYCKYNVNITSLLWEYNSNGKCLGPDDIVTPIICTYSDKLIKKGEDVVYHNLEVMDL
jgi:hypothetical protein